MSKATVALLFLLGTQFSFGQIVEAEKELKKQHTDTVEGWKKGGVINLNFSQVHLENWAAGGAPSISGNGLLSLFVDWKKDKATWTNSLDIGYGLLQQKGNTFATKTDDKIDLLSKYGQKAFAKWYYSGLLNFKTQMTPGYNVINDSERVVISNLLAPGYLLTAAGLDYKPNDKFTLFFAPATSKITFVMDQDLADAGAFGVEEAILDSVGNVITPGHNIRSEFGGYVRVMAKTDVVKNVTLQTKIDLFSNYLNNPQNLDINWETLIAMKVNKFITANVTTHLIYDDDIDIAVDTDGDEVKDAVGPRTQFKEVLAIGFSYKF